MHLHLQMEACVAGHDLD